MNNRHQTILELISKNKTMRVTELAEATGVSVVTIRHDLSYLEEQSYIKRNHGFAQLLDRDRISDRMQVNFSLKQQLARHAMSLVEDGDSVFIEAGSSNSLLARELLNFQGEIVVITVCTYIASLLKDAHFDVILLGGQLQSKSETVVGSLTRLCINHTHFNKVFLGIDGYHPEVGFTGRDMMRAEVINAVLDKNAYNIVVSDATKFGQIYPYSLHSDKINHIITDQHLSTQMRSLFAEKSITVDIVNT